MLLIDLKFNITVNRQKRELVCESTQLERHRSMSNETTKRPRESDHGGEEATGKRATIQAGSTEIREIGPGIEFEVLQAYRKFEEAINQDKVQMTRTGDIQIAMKGLGTIDSLYRKVEGTRNNGLFAHDARAMVCISELAEMSVRNLKFDDSRSLVNLDDIMNSLKKFMLKDFFTANGISENTIGHDNKESDSAVLNVEHQQEGIVDESATMAVDQFRDSINRRNHLKQFADYREFKQFNWFKMGVLFENSAKTPRTVDHMLGPLSLSKKVRASVARRARETVGAAITAEKVTQDSLSNPQEITTPEHVRRCFKILFKKKRYDRINLFKFVLDPDSFAKSVENLFYASFLIKDGRIVMEEDADGFPCVRIKEELPKDPREKGIEMQKRRDAQQNHIIFQLDMPTWRTLIEQFDIKRAFLE